MKTGTKIGRVFLGIIVVAVTLGACRKTPEVQAVVAKNDGKFEEALQAVDETPPDEILPETVSISREFDSTDESVHFAVALNEALHMGSMPVVEVAPHFLTSEDAKNIAFALFGEKTFYEAEPEMHPQYTKDEIRRKIERWSNSVVSGSVTDKFIQEYSLLMEEAPEENPHKLCNWQFKSEWHYFYGEDAEYASSDPGNDMICASVYANDVPYRIRITTRNRSDFVINNIAVFPYDGASPEGIDESLFRDMLCDDVKPDEERINEIKERAMEMLSKMDLGDWEIDNCTIKDEGSSIKSRYSITITAVPVFEGNAALRTAQLSSLKGTSEYASNYYYSDVEFQFSTNGNLLSFNMKSPVDIISVINPSVKVLDFNDLMRIAENQLKLTDAYAYDILGAGEVDREIRCQVNIEDVSYGLIRVKKKNTENLYYYIPAMQFFGNSELYNGNGELMADTDSIWGEKAILLELNAIDGSVIRIGYSQT